ncbi:MFS transporter [Spongiibacter nanhainus]|uniref:MFS transporter n=1 Tax=Spongiibacter nanhainus TaxID=2794344 RepID=A0A7T4QZ32_9GAMM|nr:MFS transporter [Spongiibacter nanhainus]QQD17352.1 MFS transporter [Spongiibacter nanhainus]
MNNVSETPTTGIEGRRKSPWPIFLVLMLGSFIAIEAATFQAPAMPTIGKHFDISEDATALLVMLYYLGLVVFSPIFGRVADSYGRKKVICLGLSCFIVSESAAALAQSFPFLVAARFVQGMSVAGILPVVLSYVAYLFPQEKRGLPLGVLIFAMSLGATTGALLGGVMIDAFGWRSIYWVSAGMGVVGLLLILWRVPETTPAQQRYQLDLPGAAMLLLTIGTLLSVPTWMSKYGLFSSPAMTALILGLVFLTLLWHIEKRATMPVFDTQIMGRKNFLLPGFIYLLFLVCHGGAIYALVFFISGRPDGNASQVGVTQMFMFGASMLAGLISGKLVDRFDERRVIIGIVVLMLTNLLVYRFFLNLSTPLWFIIVLASLLGTAQGMKGPAIMKLALRHVPTQKIGAGSGLISMMRDFGTPAGVAIGLAIFTSRRQSATQASLEDQAVNLGITNPEWLSALGDTTRAQGLSELQAALAAQGSSVEQLMSAAKLDGLASTLPAVGTIMIAVVTLALVLALSLSKPKKALL